MLLTFSSRAKPQKGRSSSYFPLFCNTVYRRCVGMMPPASRTKGSGGGFFLFFVLIFSESHTVVCSDKHTNVWKARGHSDTPIVLPRTPSTGLPLLSRGTCLVGTQTSRWEPHTDGPHMQPAQTHTRSCTLKRIQCARPECGLCAHSRASLPIILLSFSDQNRGVRDEIKGPLFPLAWLGCVVLMKAVFSEAGCARERKSAHGFV